VRKPVLSLPFVEVALKAHHPRVLAKIGCERGRRAPVLSSACLLYRPLYAQASPPRYKEPSNLPVRLL
jgi:hypothetical protein